MKIKSCHYSSDQAERINKQCNTVKQLMDSKIQRKDNSRSVIKHDSMKPYVTEHTCPRTCIVIFNFMKIYQKHEI